MHAIGMNPRLSLLMRSLIPVVERCVDLNHIYAETNPWPFLTSLSRRPIVLTIASEKGEPVPAELDRCKNIVVQTEGMKSRLANAGLNPGKIKVVYPGIDLSSFSPRSTWKVPRRPRVLFATFPRTEAELADRGVLLLLEVAQLYPEIDFTLVSRPWNSGNTAHVAVKKYAETRDLSNVTILEGLQRFMGDIYRKHDFTVIPYTTPDGGKECPRSLVEALSCGVPVLISDIAPFAPFVEMHNCGRLFSRNPQSFCIAMQQALAAYPSLSTNAAQIAAQTFDLRNTIGQYRAIYEALT